MLSGLSEIETTVIVEVSCETPYCETFVSFHCRGEDSEGGRRKWNERTNRPLAGPLLGLCSPNDLKLEAIAGRRGNASPASFPSALLVFSAMMSRKSSFSLFEKRLIRIGFPTHEIYSFTTQYTTGGKQSTAQLYQKRPSTRDVIECAVGVLLLTRNLSVPCIDRLVGGPHEKKRARKVQQQAAQKAKPCTSLVGRRI